MMGGVTAGREASEGNLGSLKGSKPSARGSAPGIEA